MNAKLDLGVGFFQIVTDFKTKNTDVFVFLSSPDKTYPQREGDSAESVAVLGSMFLGVQQLTLTVSQAVLMNL